MSVHSHSHVTRGYGFLEGFLARKRAHKANSLIQKKSRKGRVLDIGCGTIPHFLLHTEFKEKYGIDSSIADEMLDHKGIKILKSHVDDTKLPFANNHFDTVVMLAVFEHIEYENIIPLLQEIHRVLKNGGDFIITTPSPLSVVPLQVLSRLGFISKVEIEDHKHALKKSCIEKMVKSAGFEVKKIKSGYFELGMNMWFDIKK